MMKPALTITAAAGLAAGCASAPSATDPIAAPSPATAAWADQPVQIDGVLDDPVWQRAQAYPLQLAADRAEATTAPVEPGFVRFAWDERFFYAAFEFVDRDVVQENDEDHQHHYRTGDVAELFLKPVNASAYWELYVTPQGRKTAMFFPSRARRLPSTLLNRTSMVVAAQVAGTLNNWHDTDSGWTAEMAIPREELAAAGVPLNPDEPWLVLAGRYNYGVHLPTNGPEISSCPHLPKTSFHQSEHWAPLRLQPPTAE